MSKTALLLVLSAALVLGSTEPLSAEWILDTTHNFVADRKSQAHPCCATTRLMLNNVQSPGVLCVFYANNLKKGNRGSVKARTKIFGLSSDVVLPEWWTMGTVEDRQWGACVWLGPMAEPCLVETVFTLSRFPKMREKRRSRDGMTVGVMMVPDTKATGRAAVEEVERSLEERVARLLGDRSRGLRSSRN